MIEFVPSNINLILRYESHDNGLVWLYNKINESGSVRLRYTFTLGKKQLKGVIPETDDLGRRYQNDQSGVSEDHVDFEIATMVADKYYSFDRDVLNIEYDLYIHSDISLTSKEFIAVRNISIFRKLNNQGFSSLHIGGDNEEAMPEPEFRRLLKNFPNSHELNRYADARISAVVREHVSTETDHEQRYHSYLNDKLSGSSRVEQLGITEYEIDKYESIQERLGSMLLSEINYSEHRWQKEILNIIQLIYPKYIKVFDEAPVWDQFKKKWRKLDFLLLEANGNIDIIEIKKPFDKSLVTKGCYRDNHVPLRELSGSIMQVEKYIFHLNRSGEKGERKLTQKYSDQLPEGIEIKITNPSGVIIMGRSNNLTKDQKGDFEVIKRKYNNIIDILTYDDLLQRIRVMINAMKLNAKNHKIIGRF